MAKFPSDWTTSKLSDLARRITRKNADGNDNVLTISARHGLVSQQRYFNKRIAGKDLQSYFLLQRGDFAYNKSYSIGYPVGAIKRLDEDERGVVSPLYICFELLESVRESSEFLVHFFESGLLETPLRAIAREGARNHGLLNVRPSEFFSLEVTLPSPPEQRIIAAILSAVDEIIEKTEAVIEGLQTLKTAMMQELLTRGLPSRHTRFKQTEVGEIPAEWRVERLEALARVERGKFSHRPRNEPRFFGGDVPFIQTGDVAASDGRIERYTQTLNEEGVRVSRVFPAGTIVITIAANIGDTGIASFPVAFPDSLVGVQPGPDVDVTYLELVLRSRKAILEKAAPQNAQKNINLDTLRPLLIQLPGPAEQQEITAPFAALRERLEAERAVLDQYRKAKSALMSGLLSGDFRVTRNEGSS